MTLERIIELLEIEHQCILRNTNGNCDRQCGECDLVQDDSELHEMYTDVTAFLKMQAPRVLSLKTPAEWHDNVIWLEIRSTSERKSAERSLWPSAVTFSRSRQALQSTTT